MGWFSNWRVETLEDKLARLESDYMDLSQRHTHLIFEMHALREAMHALAGEVLTDEQRAKLYLKLSGLS